MSYTKIQNELNESPKKWLITGVAGFIGSNLLEKLLKLDQYVVGLDNLSTGFKENLNEVKLSVTSTQWKRFIFIKGDICSQVDCAEACKGINYVLHQAALGSVTRSIEDPLTTNKNNISGFLNMLLASRDARVNRFVYASSSSTYGDNLSLPKIEEKTGMPLSPYAVTKYVNELYAHVFTKNYGCEFIGLRYFNVFGPRQNPDGAYAAVIPKWIVGIIKNQSIYINGDGKTSRDFCYISNVIQANLLAATAVKKTAINQVYNVAFNESTTLIELYTQISNILFKNKININKTGPLYKDFRIGDIGHSLASIDKAKKLLGYKPTDNLNQGLAQMIPWYIKNIK